MSGLNSKSKVLSWSGMAATFVTILLTGWNYQMNNEVNKNVHRLNEAKFEVDRLKFVSELLEDISNKQEQDYTITVNLVKLTLGKEKAKDLFEDLSISKDSSLSSFGREGISTIELKEYQLLINGINDPDKDVRVSSLQNLIKKYNGYTPAISLTLDLFSKNRINTLTADGRVNALYFLLETKNEAWYTDQVAYAESMINYLEHRYKNKIANIGKTTRDRITKLKKKLNDIKANVDS